MSHSHLAACLIDAGRHNLYHGIHKALRLGHCRMLAELGAEDYANHGDTHAVLAKLRELIGICRAHLEGEKREIHTLLEARKPGITSYAVEEHAAHVQALAELESLIRAVEVATAARRPLAGQALYQHYALFVAADLQHMYVEETEILVALHAAFSDEQLMAIEARIAAAVPPAKLAAVTALMMPALNHIERVELLARLRQILADQDFHGLLGDAVKPSLSPQDYAAAMGDLMLRAA